MKKLIPVNDNILVKIEEMKKEEVTTNGLVISTGDAMVKPDRGVIEEVGQGRITMSGKVIKTKVKKGEEIIFNRFAGTEIELNGENFLMIKECDILAVIK